MSAIYIHIPFCKLICVYCDFYKSVRRERDSELLERILEHLDSERHFLKSNQEQTIYFGGGTPSLIDAGWIARVMERIAELYDVSELQEVTLEANPDDVSLEYLTALRRAGVNRLSFGVQSFDDDELRFMNRRHSAQQAVKAVEWAREAGFENITIDLIFGVSGYPVEILERSIDTALSLNVEHIAAYHLTIEPNTAFWRRVQRGEFAAVDESTSEREYELLHRRLTEAGYEHYEISNYALEGRRSLHNSSYWLGVEYLGLGPGAHSFSGDVRRECVSSVDEYLDAECCYTEEYLSEDDHYNEYVMTALRRMEGLDLAHIESRFSAERAQMVYHSLENWARAGVVEITGSRAAIRAEKFLLSDAVIESLFVV